MKMSWQTDADRLACRWSEVGERVQYNPCWVEDASKSVYRKSVTRSVVDFSRFSPFGGGDWYAPDRRALLNDSELLLHPQNVPL